MNNRALTISEIQKGSLEVLKVIDRICRAESLRYYLVYGTLIGAIRHKGFIPWDDDIDIMMPRPDYEKLILYFVKHENELFPYKVFDYRQDPDYPYMIARISDSRFILDFDNEKDYGIGLFVDIYPLDGAGNTQKEYEALKKKSIPYASLCYLSSRKTVKRENTKGTIKYLIKFPAFIVAKCFGKSFFMNHLEKLGKSFSYENSNYVGVIVWDSDTGFNSIYPKDWLGNGIDVSFEGFLFKAPDNWDAILKRCYGNYMELPPEKDRIPHHFYDAYKR